MSKSFAVRARAVQDHAIFIVPNMFPKVAPTVATVAVAVI